jgi:hypothetical protein
VPRLAKPARQISCSLATAWRLDAPQSRSISGS